MTHSPYIASLYLLISLFPIQGVQQIINTNTTDLYPYMNFPDDWKNGNRERFSATAEDFFDPLNVTFDSALYAFLRNAGDLTENCTLATSWYHAHNLQAGGHANFSIDYGNPQDEDFVYLAVPKFVEDYETWISDILGDPKDRFIISVILYGLFANDTEPVGNAVFNITRPAIEMHCLSLDLAEEFSWQPQNDCNTALSQWQVPGLEWLDVILRVQNAFTALPTEYKNISIQTFWGWYNLQTNLSTEEGIKARKRECYQEVCSDLQTSGNPDIAGIGMFVSYIIAAILATLIILQTCWHNWKYRDDPVESLSSNKTEPSFVKVANAFLNTGIVLLLSLAVSLVAVASHETILYNGIITHVACYFTASATIAVASMPRRGSDRDSIFWVILLFSTFLSTISMNLAGQYDVKFDSSALDTISDPFDILWDNENLQFIPQLNYSTGASEYPGIQSSLQINTPTNFTVASCLIWSFLYQQGSISYITNYLPFSLYVQEILYFFGILVFFILTRITWARDLVLRSTWMRQHEDQVILWARLGFSFFAWLNMLLGLICITMWRRVQEEAMGSYYTEAEVGYGQVLSLFMWAPVLATILQLGTKRTRNRWHPYIPKVPIWYRRRRTPPLCVVESQNSIPLLQIPASHASGPITLDRPPDSPPSDPLDTTAHNTGASLRDNRRMNTL